MPDVKAVDLPPEGGSYTTRGYTNRGGRSDLRRKLTVFPGLPPQRMGTPIVLLCIRAGRILLKWLLEREVE